MTTDQEKPTPHNLDDGVQTTELSSVEQELVDKLLSKEKYYRKRAKVLEYSRSVGHEILLSLGEHVRTARESGNDRILSSAQSLGRRIVECTNAHNKFNAIRNYLNLFTDDLDVDWGCIQLETDLERLKSEFPQWDVNLVFMQIFTAKMLKRSTLEFNSMQGDELLKQAVLELHSLQNDHDFKTGYYDCILELISEIDSKEVIELLRAVPLNQLDAVHTLLVEKNQRVLAELFLLDHWVEVEQAVLQTEDRTLLLRITNKLPSLDMLKLIAPNVVGGAWLGAVVCKYLQVNDIECSAYLIETFPELKNRSDIAVLVTERVDPELGMQYLQTNPEVFTIAEYVAERLKKGSLVESIQILEKYWNVFLAANDFAFKFGIRQLVSAIPKCELSPADAQVLFELLMRLAYQYPTPTGIVVLVREGSAAGMNTEMLDDLKNNLRLQIELELSMQSEQAFVQDFVAGKREKLFEQIEALDTRQIFSTRFEAELEGTTHKLQKMIDENVLQMANDEISNCLKLCLLAGKEHSGEELLVSIANSRAPATDLIDMNFQLIADYISRGVTHPTRVILFKLINQEGVVPSPTSFHALFMVSDADLKRDLCVSVLAAMSTSKKFEHFITYYLSTVLEEQEYGISLTILEALPTAVSRRESKELLKCCLSAHMNHDFKLSVVRILERRGVALEFPYEFLTALVDAQMPHDVTRLFPDLFKRMTDADLEIIFTKLVDSIVFTGAFNLIAPTQALIKLFPVEVRVGGSVRLARLHAHLLLEDVLAQQSEVLMDDFRALQLCRVVEDTQIPADLENKLLPVLIDLGIEPLYTKSKTQNLSSAGKNEWKKQKEAATVAQLSDIYDVVLPTREKSVFSLPLPWTKMCEIWRRYIRMKNDPTILNLTYLDELEHRRPNASIRLTDPQSFNISCFGRYPTELLVTMVDGVDSDLSHIAPLLVVNEDHNGYTYVAGQQLDGVAKTCIDEQVVPMVFELEGMYDLLKRIVAILKETRKQKKVVFSLVLSHGLKKGVSVGKSEFLQPDYFSPPAVNVENETYPGSGITKKELYERVQQIVRQLQQEVFTPDTPLAVLSCDQGGKDELADVLSQVFSARVWGGDGYVVVSSIAVNKDASGKFSFSIELHKTATVTNYASGQLIDS